MPRKWASTYLCLLAVVLSAGLIVAGFGLASGEEPPPTPRPEKLDAVLTGLLAQQKAAGEPTTGGGADKLLPLHRDEAGNIYVDVLMKSSGSLKGYASLGVTVQAVVGDVVAARIPLRSLGGLTNLATVDSMEASLLLYPSNDLGGPASGAPLFRNTSGVDGSGAIVGVIDTGVDFTHGDFRNPDGTTRIKFLCDQTDPPQPTDNTCPGGGSPVGGTLWTEAQINTSLQGGPAVRQTDGDGHGTHVLGSAAGDDAVFGGMAPGADLIVVKAGDGSFPTTNIVSGMSFIDGRAASLGLPYVINMSLEGQIGPHDGTDLMSQAINNIAGPGKPGKVIAVAAGNDGGDAIHAGGNVTLGTQTRSFNLPGGTEAAFVDIWYDGQDSFGFSFAAPGGGIFGPFVPGAFFSTCFPGTHTCVQVDHTVPQAGNGDIEVFMVLFPNSGFQTIDLTGAWSFSLAGNVVNLGNFDAWIQCNGAFCDFSGGDDLSTIGQPGVAQGAITAGSYTTKDCWPSIAGGSFCWNPRPTVGEISFFSSLGPTRDGRQKPDIAGPGEAVVSSKSKDASFGNSSIAPDNQHVTLRGTSMATPLVAGAVALLLATDPTLDSAQIKGMLQTNATKDGFTGPGCGNVWGCGKLNLAPLANAAPIALDDTATVVDGGTVTVLDSGQASVLANDSDPEAGGLTASTTPVSGPANGVLTLNANGTFSYIHDGTETTGDSITYQVCDSTALLRCATATVSITVNQVPPGAPTLVFPEDAPARRSFLNDNTPFFEWAPSAGDVVDYLLQVSSADTFNPHLDIEVTVLHPGTGHQANSPLSDATYRWRVIARDLALNNASSVTRSFTIDTVPPGPPIPVVPSSNQVLPTNTPTFVWVAPAGEPVEDYRLQVTSGGSFNPHLDIDAQLSGDTTQLQVLPGDALADAVYQWRVIARDGAVNTTSSVTQSFTVDTTPPDPPILLLPGSGSLINDNTPFFQWTPSAGDVVVYFLQVSSADTFNPHLDIEVVIPHPGTGHQTVAPLNDAIYRWRVTASDAVGNTSDSEVRTFTLDTTAPGVPSLVSPLDNAFLNDNTPFFEWNPVTGDVFDYVLHVTSGDINTGPFDIDLVVPAAGILGTGHRATAPLNDGLYRWQVIARDQAGNPQPYGIRRFTIDIITPDAPALLAPADNAILTTRTPFFDWDDSPTPADVVEYRIQVTSGGSFNPHLDIDVLLSGDSTQFQVPAGDALADAIYQWRVIARDRAVNTASSQTQNFTVDTTPPDPPVLVLPGSGDLTNDNTPFFEWTSSSGDVAVYFLRVTSGDINTGPFDIDKPIAAPTSSDQTVTPLNDAIYRWRVTASDAVGNTASSVTRTFTVDITAPGVPLPVSPLDNAFLNDNTPLFEWEPVAGDVFDYVLHVTSGDIIVGPFGIDVVIPAAGIPGTGHQTVTPLNDGLYRWQVIARDQAGNPQPYGIRTFTIDIVTPDAPVLLAAADNAILTTRTPFFDWDDSPTPADVAEYRLQVTSGGSFDQPLDMDVVIIGTPPATEFQTLTGDALADGTYGWRVIAFDRAGNTAISVAHSFTISRPPLIAETSLVQSLDADGVAVLGVRVDEVVDTTGDSFTLLGGIGRYEAEVTFDDVCMAMLEVRGVASFVAPQHTTVGGRLLITADQVTGAPQVPLILAKLVVRLTGDATTPCGVSLTRLRIFEALGNRGDPIPERDIPSKSLLRADASGNGVVNSFDALVILQFVVGMPLRQPAGEGPGKLRPIEAASVFQDGVSGDTVSAFDALAIQQFLVELRDSRFLLK